jgi:hypothetical protein
VECRFHPREADAPRGLDRRAASTKGKTMKNLHQCIVGAIAAAGLAATTGVATAADIHTRPPASFKKVSTLVTLPEYLPGLGVLYVDPATLPVGPFLGYDRKGKLVNVVYMVPLKDLEAHKNFNRLGAGLGNLKIDHTDIAYNPGHPGVEEPHYHVVEWLLTPQRQDADLK